MFATDSLGTKVWEASYLPFGGVQTSTGANTNLRFPGQWFQSETALHQNWMRDYDPTTGRYIQADPLGLVPGPSVYGYAMQSPMMYVDPDGENPFLIGMGIGLALGLLNEYMEHGTNFQCYSLANIAISSGFGAFGGGLGSALGRTGLTRGLGSLSNNAKGRVGETLSYVSNRLSGNSLISTQTRIPGYRTIVDSVWRTRNGATKYVESKFGRSTLTRPQRAARDGLGSQYSVERWSYGFMGDLGSYLGLPVGASALALVSPNFADRCECEVN